MIFDEGMLCDSVPVWGTFTGCRGKGSVSLWPVFKGTSPSYEGPTCMILSFRRLDQLISLTWGIGFQNVNLEEDPTSDFREEIGRN